MDKSFIDGVFLRETDYTKFDTFNVQKIIFNKYNAGLYKDNESVKDICDILYNEYGNRLNKLIEDNGSFELLEFFFVQLDRVHLLQEKSGNVGVGGYRNWVLLKQLYKFLIEKIIEKHSYLNKERSLSKDVFNEIVALGEEIFHLSATIAEVRNGESCEVSLKEIGNQFGTSFCDIAGGNNAFVEQFKNNLRLYNSKYSKEFPNNWEEDFKAISNLFKENFGFTYDQYLLVFRFVFDNIFPTTNLGVSYISVDDLVLNLKNNFSISDESIQLILNSMTLSNQNMKERYIYKPNTEFRFYSRCLAKFTIDGVEMYYWVPFLVKEAYSLLKDNFMRGIVPSDFAINVNFKKGIGKLSTVYARKFEKYLAEKLKEIGLVGSNWEMNKEIEKNSTLKLPSCIGEIDWIGFDVYKNRVIFFEFKTNKLAAISIQQQDEIKKFFEYKNKFVKKIDRIAYNYQQVVRSLNSKYGLDLKDPIFKKYIITENPTKFANIQSEVEVYCFCTFLEDYQNL